MAPGPTTSTTLVASVAIMGVVALSLGARASADEPAHPNRAELFNALRDAHDLLTAKKYADAISKLKAAETTKGKTPYDQHLINDNLAFAYIHTGAYVDAAKTMEAEVDDGFT